MSSIFGGKRDDAASAERSLFSLPVERHEEERGRIYHEILKRDEKQEEKAGPKAKTEKDISAESASFDIKEEPIVTALPRKRENAPAIPEDDESWGAIPAFLRRHKK